jgi:CTP synthase (UTP-ammonia lyase)
MKRPVRIGIVADYDPKNKYHVATEQSVTHAAEALGIPAESIWLDTDKLDNSASAARLAECDAIWCGTSSPYRSMDGALRAIRFARERGVPFVGTWGGFQHTLVEYARNVLGLTDADHEESSPDAQLKLISKLTCSLVGQKRIVGIVPGTQAHRIYGRNEATEIFACNYGLNEAFAQHMRSGELRVSGYDEDGTVRMVELPGHPFFIGTLFVPQMLSARGKPHPIIASYLQAANAG